MKEKSKYHFWDIVNLTIFYSVFICFFVSLILGTIDFFSGSLPLKELIYRIALNILVCLPYFVKKIFKVSFSRVVGIVFYIYMFMAGFLGVELKFYEKIEIWDMLIHFLMGACLSVLSIYILNYTIYKKDRSKHNMFFTFLFMICFALAFGVIWEILEFTSDTLFNTGFQRYFTYSGSILIGQNALKDTMVDLIMDFSGALAGVVFTCIVLAIDKNFLKSFYIKKLKKLEKEVEDIEE